MWERLWREARAAGPLSSFGLSFDGFFAALLELVDARVLGLARKAERPALRLAEHAAALRALIDTLLGAASPAAAAAGCEPADPCGSPRPGSPAAELSGAALSLDERLNASASTRSLDERLHAAEAPEAGGAVQLKHRWPRISVQTRGEVSRKLSLFASAVRGEEAAVTMSEAKYAFGELCAAAGARRAASLSLL